jgi:hypothetical protein
MRALKLVLPAAFLMTGFLVCTTATYGRPEYSKKEMTACGFCHATEGKERNGENLTEAGTYYKTHDHKLGPYEGEQVKRREAALQQQRQAEQRKQSEIAARSSAFVKANGVTHFVTVEQLAPNPFVYKGQVVAICGVFQQMNSATQGVFSSHDQSFVVSGIPTARFTQQRSVVMLAGSVLGNIEIKLPVLGPTLVPHLSFVGSAFCQQQECSEYSINPR